MNTILVLPLPFNVWPHFKDGVLRFAKTFKQFDPGHDYELYAVCQWGEPTDCVKEWFHGIKTRWTHHNGNGRDIEVCQSVANMAENAFVIGFSSTCYFHREGWLKRLMEVRLDNGPGLYSTAGSMEGFPHLRTAGYGMDSFIWQNLPLVSTCKEAHDFEHGKENIALVLGNNPQFSVRQVLWDSDQILSRSRVPEGIFRRGNQNAMLVWDRITDEYRDAPPDEKKRLERLVNGE